MRSEGYSSWFVCLSVCRRLFWYYRLRGGLLAMPAASELREPEKLVGDFPETTAFERYAAKKAKKPIWKTSTGLPRPGSLAVYLGGTRSHDEWRVSTPACYLLL